METFGWIAALLLAFAAHSANAQEEGSEDGAAESPYVRDGAYLGLGGIAAIENFDASFPPSRPIDRWSGGLSARGGLRTHPHMAGELIFDWVSPWATVGGDITSYLITGNAKFNVLTGRIQPYVILGIGMMILVEDLGAAGSGTSVPPGGRFGIGVDFYIDEHLLVNFEGVYAPPLNNRIDDFPYGMLQGNLMYRF